MAALGLYCCTWAFSSCSRGYSLLQWADFSLQWLLLSRSMGSRCSGSVVVANRPSFPMACGNLPGPGLKSVSLALQGCFLTTDARVKSGIPISLRIFHILLWSTQSKSLALSEADVLLEFPCLLYDLTNVGNLISDSFAFSKSILYIWKFSVHMLLKTRLKDFEHNLASEWN